MADLLFDIGGTRTRLAATTEGGFSEPVFIETPQKFEEAVELIAKEAKKVCGDQIGRAVGGLAGSLDKEKQGLYRAPNLLDWEQKNFVEALSSQINANVVIENDTAIVGLGEAVHGAGKLYNIIAYITISTGVNGVKIANKKIDENVFGYEIGHQIIDVSTHLDMTENKGELEDYISGRELEKKYKDLKDIEEKDWRSIAEHAAVGIFNSIVHWSPEVVILGGGLIKHIPLEIVKDKLHNMLSSIYPESPEIVKAELGAIGGIYGASFYSTTF